MLALTLFTAAYMAEVVRGGLQGIPKGQPEAAYSLGLGYWQVQGLVVMPQALRMVLPAIVNTVIDLFKDTTLVAIVGITDLLGVVRPGPARPGLARPRPRRPISSPASSSSSAASPCRNTARTSSAELSRGHKR